jgi:hypothetical protein
MPLVTETVIDALAHCADQRCEGYKQRPVKAVQTVTQFSYLDLGGDLPGIERESFLLRFDDIADTQCPHCGEPRIVADQTRPIYPNVSGQPQDALLRGTRDAERVRELELADARREAEMAQMRATMERLAAANDRLMDRLETPRARGGRPVKDDPQA